MCKVLYCYSGIICETLKSNSIFRQDAFGCNIICSHITLTHSHSWWNRLQENSSKISSWACSSSSVWRFEVFYNLHNQLSRGEICVATCITPANGASLGSYFEAKNLKSVWKQFKYAPWLSVSFCSVGLKFWFNSPLF